MSKRMKELEKKLTPQQVNACRLLSDNEFGLLSPEDGKKLSKQEVSEKIGIVRSTLYEWLKIPAFVELMNEYSEHTLNAHRSEVYDLLMKGIRGHNGIPSSKMLELYLKHYALLTDKSIIENISDDDRMSKKSDSEIAKEIDELNKLINGEGTH